MNAKWTTTNLYDETDALLCPVSRQFPYMTDEDRGYSPLANDYLSVSPSLGVDLALAECGMTYGATSSAIARRMMFPD